MLGAGTAEASPCNALARQRDCRIANHLGCHFDEGEISRRSGVLVADTNVWSRNDVERFLGRGLGMTGQGSANGGGFRPLGTDVRCG